MSLAGPSSITAFAHNAMEPRGALGWYDTKTDTFQLVLSSQNVHVIRDHIAASLGVCPSRVQVSAPDVGGGFGIRNFIYGDYILVLFAARLIGQPVKWINTRSDGLLCDHQARNFRAEAALALDRDGRFIALSMDSQFNLGAYLIGAGGGVPTGQFCTCPDTVYDIGHVYLNIQAVLTNTVPVGVTRGPGFAEAVDVIEKLIDAAAYELNIDRFALRRRNLISATHMPWHNGADTVIDSGNFPACFERALAVADVAGAKQRATRARSRGLYLGIGLAYHLKATGGLDEENIEFRFEGPKLVLTTGTQAIGQGHETPFRQLAGSLFGLDFQDIDYRAGDSHIIAMGGGHGSSRATYMASTAMHQAAQIIKQKGCAYAAKMLKAATDDIIFTDGYFTVSGTDRRVHLFETAAYAKAQDTPLDTYYHFRRTAMTFRNGCHMAEIELDPETGCVTLMRSYCGGRLRHVDQPTTS